MLNKESEYTYVTSKDSDVENGDFGKNVGMTIDTEKMSIRHGGLDEGGSSILDDLIDRSITEITNSTVTSIGEGAFHGCSALTSVNLPNVTSIGNDAFSGCSALTSVNLPNATSIGMSAFNGCSALTSVNLPNVTSIDRRAFNAISSTAVINIGAAEGEIKGAPWGAPSGVTINYNVK